MSAQHEPACITFSQFEQLREARDIIRLEADALHNLSQRIDTEFCAAVDLLHRCRGKVIVTGMGKAGLIAQKVAATLSSTGTRGMFVHPADAVHGDLGVLHADDVVLMLSNSGETEEIRRLVPLIRQAGNPIVAITAEETSSLGIEADVTLTIGRLREAGFGLAPTTTTTTMLALGDALALVVSRLKGFTPQQFAVYHPGGSLGHQLRCVRDIMRRGDQLRIASQEATIREVFAEMRKPGRRTGAVMLVDGDGCLSGLFTDSDLVRLLETRREHQLDRPISEVMTPRPFTIKTSALLIDAVNLLSRHRVSELPVIDDDHRPIGLIDITDVIGLVPADAD